MHVETDPDVSAIVRAAWCTVGPVVVRAADERLDVPLREAAAAMRGAVDTERTVGLVRAMYSRTGVDPTKTRPSSEALLRRVRKGGELPRINSLVDVINWCSLESQLPFGLYDAAHIRGDVTLRLGRDGEGYPGIRKDTVHLAGRLALTDEDGPFGNPTSDSARTMVTVATTSALVVVYAPAAIAADTVDRVLARTRARVAEYCSA